MMRAILSFATALALATPGLAKPVYGQPSNDLSIQAIHNFAACVADTTPRGAEHLLALDYRSPEYQKQLDRLVQGHADGRCVNASRMQFSGTLLAGGMAERLLIETVKPDRFVSAVAYDAARPPIEARSPTEMVSICVVRADPAKSWTLFETAPTSREELAALQAIGPTLMGCIPSGQKMALNRQGVRAMLALAAYRLSMPPAVASVDGKPMAAAPVQQ